MCVANFRFVFECMCATCSCVSEYVCLCFPLSLRVCVCVANFRFVFECVCATCSCVSEYVCLCFPLSRSVCC